jgi:SnoaL-like domain
VGGVAASGIVAGMGQAFRSAVEARDLDLMRDALHPQVRFFSPVVFKPYEGRDAVMRLLGHVIEVFEAFRYTDQLEGVGSSGLVFKAKVGDKEVQGWDFLQLDSAGLVTELTVMVRPLSGAIALAEAMGARLAADGDAAAT